MSHAIISSGKDFENWYLRLIRKAKSEIWISTFRFENPLNKKSKVLDKLFFELKQATMRKVKVRVLMNLYDEKIRAGQVNKKTVRELSRFGIECRRPQGNICNHAKLLLVDREELIVGSHNITRHSFGPNFEVSIYYRGCIMNEQIREIFTDAWSTFIPL